MGLDGYTASFVAMAPMDDPQCVVMVNIQRPQGKHLRDLHGTGGQPIEAFNEIGGVPTTHILCGISQAPSPLWCSVGPVQAVIPLLTMK